MQGPASTRSLLPRDCILKGMALKRQLLVAVGAAVCLLLVYMLSNTMQIPFPYPRGRPNGFGEHGGISTSNTSPPKWSNLSQPNPTAAVQYAALKINPVTKPPKPAQNQSSDALKPSSRSKGEDQAKKSPVALPGNLIKPRGPTEPPYIGDSYMSENIPPQTDCPDGIRSRIKKSEFGGLFLEHIPVLQWAQHATREQHQRLKQYPGTHGWGGIDYDTLKDTLSVLNSSANWRMLDDWETRKNTSECSSCAVVGNGGILKESKKGKEIDGHHYVFRTNGAVIKGFEEDVGSRTTHYTFSTNTLMNSMRSYAGAGYYGPPVSQETRYVFLPDHDRDYLLMKAAATHILVEKGHDKGNDPTKYFGKDVSAAKLKMYHPDFIRYLRNRFLRSNILNTKYKSIYRPSTGAAMLLAALHSCDQVSAYGFMTPDYANYSDHYYDKTYHKVGFFVNHDMRMEMNVWQRLHKEGLIKLYMRQEKPLK
ncbi:alpha-N-acetylgalactosaminide alpha-2,6-sialyltransferase 2 [Cyprinodon tularosa]|uniref:alpha-N-acetylgalactosaminide alpha-2,6-sialyltransferase 2 n=1 Tax=Cyprinodon tularosa TaxID=77115 RepID=UPI0018E24CBF|nr:alpha-N-acetylgalactosaminide alpha-2,6-sialyltransferase 2 [Cyprinodon tularosa]XP_038130091.1 alpha-N-acetylgalactosaminide alpha-2,6-sialyltransferase 2 [Cyprinodon tularosa]